MVTTAQKAAGTHTQRTQTVAEHMTDCGFLPQMAVQRSMTRLEQCLIQCVVKPLALAMGI